MRRLAALATESLDLPVPAIERSAPLQPGLRLDEELERILRNEARLHGIDADE